MAVRCGPPCGRCWGGRRTALAVRFRQLRLTIVETYADNAVLRLFNDTSHLGVPRPALSYD